MSLQIWNAPFKPEEKSVMYCPDYLLYLYKIVNCFVKIFSWYFSEIVYANNSVILHYTFLFPDPSVLTATLKGHTDAVWGLSIHSSKLQLLSCSADGTVRLWSPQCKVPLLHTYGSDIGIALKIFCFIYIMLNLQVFFYGQRIYFLIFKCKE